MSRFIFQKQKSSRNTANIFTFIVCHQTITNNKALPFFEDGGIGNKLSAINSR
jgi:hypothetical protein